ncbi:MAG: hypothetical protein HYZ85_03195 [Candidatus Omnitrophica bacterium]|nr:hypothetical protein [Candidatus Omnitrophota bacterium]
MMNFQYSQARLSIKFLVTWFLMLVGISYVFGLINIYNNTGFSFTGVVVHYRGAVGEELPLEFAFSKLIHEHHVHLFSISMLFFLVGLLFAFTNLPEKIKVVCISMPFVGMALDFASFWLMVFQSPLFAWIAMVFGSLMAISFFLLLGRPLYEMWLLPLFLKITNNQLPWFLK